MRRLVGALISGTVLLLPARAPAQWAGTSGARWQAHDTGAVSSLEPAAAHGLAPRASRTPWWTPLASAALPGAGQAVLRQDRFIAYLALEGYLWARYAADVQQGRSDRAAYRELASAVARAFFSEDKPPGDFTYYERMQHFVESGVFDRYPGGDLQPELDTTTFNGALWLRARTTYFSHPDSLPPRDSPAYQLALGLYEKEAVRPEFRWSWRNAQLEQDLFRRTIERSNDAFRRSVQDLGVILANHVLSTIDAYVSIRLRYGADAPRDLGVSASLPWAPFGRGRSPPAERRRNGAPGCAGCASGGSDRARVRDF